MIPFNVRDGQQPCDQTIEVIQREVHQRIGQLHAQLVGPDKQHVQERPSATQRFRSHLVNQALPILQSIPEIDQPYCASMGTKEVASPSVSSCGDRKIHVSKFHVL